MIDNTSDPVADERFPNIVEYSDEHDGFLEDDDFPCATKTIEEVHQDG